MQRTHRGFTLIETMVVVAILGIIAALALPSVLVAQQKSSARAFSVEVAALIAQARARAMSDRRCTRVRVDSATAPPRVVAEVLNVFDCDDSSEGFGSAARIAGGLSAPLWLPIGEVTGRSTVTVGLNQPSPDLTTEIRYRSTGRIWSSDTNLLEDDAGLEVGHSQLTGGTYWVLAESSGALCTLAFNVTLPIDPNGGFQCP